MIRWRNISNYLPGSCNHVIRKKNLQITQILNLVSILLDVRAHKERNLQQQAGVSIMPESMESMSNAYDLRDEADNHEQWIHRKVKKESNTCSQTIIIENAKIEKRFDSVSKLIIPIKMTSYRFKNYFSQSLEPKKQSLSNDRLRDQQKKRAAFKLKVIYHSEFFSTLSSENKALTKVIYWEDNSAEYKIERKDFLFLPESLSMRISREHATIRCSQNVEEGLIFKQNDRESNSEGGNLAVDVCQSNSASFSERKSGSREADIKYILQNQSSNGTYILKRHCYGVLSSHAEIIKGEFKILGIGDKIELQQQDIIAIRINNITKEVAFGFQFLCENL